MNYGRLVVISLFTLLLLFFVSYSDLVYSIKEFLKEDPWMKVSQAFILYLVLFTPCSSMTVWIFSHYFDGFWKLTCVTCDIRPIRKCKSLCKSLGPIFSLQLQTDLQIILSLLGTGFFNLNPTGKCGEKYGHNQPKLVQNVQNKAK